MIGRWLALTWQLVRPYGRWFYYALFPARRPQYFRDAWRYPCARSLKDTNSNEPESLPRAPTLVFFPMNDWHVRMQRSQHLATALARNGRLCIYVNPHLGLEYSVPYILSRSPQVRTISRNLLELHVHLPREHELSRRPLLPSEAGRIVNAVRRVLGNAGAPQAVLLTSSPAWLPVLEQLRDRYGLPILYDCHDLLDGFTGISAGIIEAERGLMRICDRVVYSSANLMKTMGARHPGADGKATIIRNAVTPADFEAGPNSAREVRRPTVGYIGALDTWFDCDAIREAAVLHPSVDFVLVGAIRDPGVARLKQHPNVRLLGEIPYSQLWQHLASWSAALIPFLRNPLTLATSPIKIYEYFSVGLPVVATRLPEVEHFSGLVYLADTPRQFADGVALALRENDPALVERRKAIASRETWTARAEALLALVENIPAR